MLDDVVPKSRTQILAHLAKTNPKSSQNSSAPKKKKYIYIYIYIFPLKAAARKLKMMVYKFSISSFFSGWFLQILRVCFCWAPHTPSATPRTIGDAKVASASCMREGEHLQFDTSNLPTQMGSFQHIRCFLQPPSCMGIVLLKGSLLTNQYKMDSKSSSFKDLRVNKIRKNGPLK